MVAVGMGGECLGLADDDAVDLLAEVGKLLRLKTAGEEFVRKLLRSNIDVYVIF